jgi:nucleotide-binding universal stress UspA family protein
MQRIKSWSKQVTDYLNENNVEAKNTYHKGDSVTDLIIDYATENNIDLISIMTEQDSPLSGFVIGSNAQQLINKAPVPILCNTPKDLNIRGRFKTHKGVPPA